MSLEKVKEWLHDKDLLTRWMNNLLVVYTFLLPISASYKAKVFVVILILFILRGNIVQYIKEALRNSVVRAFLYLFLIYAVGLLWTDNVKHGLEILKSVKYGLYLIIFYSFVDGRYISKIISAFIFGMLLSELLSYGMILGLLPWNLDIGGVVVYHAYAVGDPSPFLHHIHYSVALAFVVLLLGQRIIYSNYSKLVKILMSIFVVTATLNIFYTGGRTGYVTFVLLLLVLAVSYLRKYILAIVVAVPLVFSFAYFNSKIFAAKVTETQKSVQELFKEEPNFNTSIGQRVGLYRYAWEVVKEHPLFGVGTGDSMDEIEKKVPKKYIGIRSMPHEHNQFLSVLVALGIVGLLVFLNIYYQIFKYRQPDRELRFIMIVATLAITSGVLTTQFNLRFFMPLWAVMLAISLIDKSRRTISKEIDDKKVNREIILATILFYVGGSLWKYKLH